MSKVFSGEKREFRDDEHSNRRKFFNKREGGRNGENKESSSRRSFRSKTKDTEDKEERSNEGETNYSKSRIASKDPEKKKFSVDDITDKIITNERPTYDDIEEKTASFDNYINTNRNPFSKKAIASFTLDGKETLVIPKMNESHSEAIDRVAKILGTDKEKAVRL